MTARNAMIHRCTIQSNESAAVGAVRDEWGNEEPAEWSASSTQTGVACRYQYRDSVTTMDGERRVFSSQPVLYLPVGTSVSEDDRILQVTDRRGRVVADGPLRIDSLGLHEQDHLFAKLVEIS